MSERVDADRYVQRRFPAEPEPPLHDPAEQTATWGRAWGQRDDVGPLRDVLVRRPGDEWTAVRAQCWDEQANALVDPDRNWFWEAREAPDVGRMRDEHDALTELFRAQGVAVHEVGTSAPNLVNAVYLRDPLCMLPGGAVISRMGVRMRRGEERHVAAALASLGVPILRTIHGTGTLEGGTFAKLAPSLWAVGTSVRVNEEGARQLGEVVRAIGGAELLVVPLTGWSIHLDGHIVMVDRDKALVDAKGLPHWFIARLLAEGIELIDVHPDEHWALNSLALAPGRIVMSEGHPHTRRALEARGVEVLVTPYAEIQKGGGGIHCSTQELHRAPSSA